MANKPGKTTIQTYLACPNGLGIKIGKPVSLQCAVEMALGFTPAFESEKKCFNGGDVELSYSVDKKYNDGVLTFVLPFNKRLPFLCEQCYSTKIPMSSKQQMETCAKRISKGYCTDPVVSTAIGAKLFPNKYNKTR